MHRREKLSQQWISVNGGSHCYCKLFWVPCQIFGSRESKTAILGLLIATLGHSVALLHCACMYYDISQGFIQNFQWG